MFNRVGITLVAVQNLLEEHGQLIPKQLVCIDKNANDICNVTRKPDSKIAKEMPDCDEEVSMITEENLKLVTFTIKH